MFKPFAYLCQFFYKVIVKTSTEIRLSASALFFIVLFSLVPGYSLVH